MGDESASEDDGEAQERVVELNARSVADMLAEVLATSDLMLSVNA